MKVLFTNAEQYACVLSVAPFIYKLTTRVFRGPSSMSFTHTALDQPLHVLSIKHKII